MSGALHFRRRVVCHLNRTELARLLAHGVVESRAGGHLPGKSVDMVPHVFDQHRYQLRCGRSADSGNLDPAAAEEDEDRSDGPVWTRILVSRLSS